MDNPGGVLPEPPGGNFGTPGGNSGNQPGQLQGAPAAYSRTVQSAPRGWARPRSDGGEDRTPRKRPQCSSSGSRASRRTSAGSKSAQDRRRAWRAGTAPRYESGPNRGRMVSSISGISPGAAAAPRIFPAISPAKIRALIPFRVPRSRWPCSCARGWSVRVAHGPAAQPERVADDGDRAGGYRGGEHGRQHAGGGQRHKIRL
jgi:hypothetical protein